MILVSIKRQSKVYQWTKNASACISINFMLIIMSMKYRLGCRRIAPPFWSLICCWRIKRDCDSAINQFQAFLPIIPIDLFGKRWICFYQSCYFCISIRIEPIQFCTYLNSYSAVFPWNICILFIPNSFHFILNLTHSI